MSPTNLFSTLQLMANRCSCLLLFIFFSVANVSFQEGLEFSAEGTGETTGLIANLIVRNSGNSDVTISIGPWFIPSLTLSNINDETGQIEVIKYQSYITTEQIIVTIPAGQTVIVPIASGLCTDIFSPPVPKGVSMPPYSEWTPIAPIGEAPPGISEGNAWTGSPGLAKNPFTGEDLPGTIEIDKHPEVAGPILYQAAQNIANALDNLYASNSIHTPFSSNKEKERTTIIQQTIWIYSAALTGTEYKKEEFKNQLVEQLETSMGISITELPEKQQAQFTSGAENFWDTFTLTGEQAKIFGNTPDTTAPGTSVITGDPPPPPEETDPPPPEDPPTYYGEEEPVCALNLTPIVEPAMDGGLKKEFKPKELKIKRDDFLPLGAEGLDFDQVKWQCKPANDCPDKQGEKTIPLTGKVKYTWEIITGEGNFVQLGCLPILRAEEGDYVIFQPPFVPLEEGQASNEKLTSILLKIIDDNPSQAIDQTVERRITIETKRKKTNPDHYFMTVTSDNYKLPALPAEVLKPNSCDASDEEWKNPNDLVIPTEQKPGVEDNDKMVVGQLIRLFSINQDDSDEKTLHCKSSSCTPTTQTINYEDDLEWEWKILTGGDAGSFINGSKGVSSDRQKDAKGRYVIYEAPMKLEKDKNFIDVDIQITIRNPKVNKKTDVEKIKKFTIRVYKAGIELERTYPEWLPEKSNSLALLSELKYHDGTDWQDALAHMCRIHFFDLVDNSREQGYCTNAPTLKQANTCYDYKLAEGELHELFNDRKRDDSPSSKDCENTDNYLLEARTKRPVREYTMTIQSEDYGGYSKLFSLGNINVYDPKKQLKEEPLYISIPVEKDGSDVRAKSKKEVYEDNRVTIPRDIDENMIADNGWTATLGSGRQRDPDNNKSDEDSQPTGDGLNEDGYTAYEEYRGFDVVSPEAGHTRTDLIKKDLMIWNDGGFSLGLFRSASELAVHEVGEQNLIKENRVYMSNFNSPTYNEHKQAGLKILDKGTSGSKGGEVNSIKRTDRGETHKNPAPPNWVEEVWIYVKTLERLSMVKDGFISYDAKSSKVVAHELGHACNVYHHGEGTGSDQSKNYNNKNGPRSGNLNCIMRYDNLTVMSCQELEETEIEVEVNGRMRTRKDKIEPVGSIFCTSSAGTGYNASNDCFGDCKAGRGDCKHQFRVSGRTADYPNRD